MLFGIIPYSALTALIPGGEDTWYFFSLKISFWLIILWLPVYNKLTSKVMAGHEALRVHNGTPSVYKFGRRKGEPIVYTSGRPLQVPFWHELWQINVQDQTLDLEEQTREKDSITFENVKAALVWRVTRSDVALLKQEKLVEMIGTYAASYLCTLVDIRKLSNQEIPQQLMRYRDYLDQLAELQKRLPGATLELPADLVDTKNFAEKVHSLGIEPLDLLVKSSRRTNGSQLGASMRGLSKLELMLAAVGDIDGDDETQLDGVPVA